MTIYIVTIKASTGVNIKCSQKPKFHIIIKTHANIFPVSSKAGIMAGSLVDAFRHFLTTFLGMKRFLVQSTDKSMEVKL